MDSLELYHHGVKGMRWGHRKTRQSGESRHQAAVRNRNAIARSKIDANKKNGSKYAVERAYASAIGRGIVRNLIIGVASATVQNVVAYGPVKKGAMIVSSALAVHNVVNTAQNVAAVYRNDKQRR